MKYEPCELLPQQEPMMLISGIESADIENNIFVTRIDVKKTDLFYDEKLGGVPACIALEYMAQSIGCFIGYADKEKNPNGEPAIGFLLGSRHITIDIEKFDVDKTYFVGVAPLFCDENIASFDCKIYDTDNKVLASGTLNAFRPDNIKTFMTEVL